MWHSSVARVSDERSSTLNFKLCTDAAWASDYIYNNSICYISFWNYIFYIMETQEIADAAILSKNKNVGG